MTPIWQEYNDKIGACFKFESFRKKPHEKKWLWQGQNYSHTKYKNQPLSVTFSLLPSPFAQLSVFALQH